MLRSIDEAHRDVIAPVLRKHKDTLRKIEALIQSGASARATVLWRKSGLLDDLSDAISAANQEAEKSIREGIKNVRKAVRDDTARASPP